MTNPQLMALELDGEDEQTLLSLLKGGNQSKLHEFLMGKVDQAKPITEEEAAKLEARAEKVLTLDSLTDDAVKAATAEVDEIEKLGKGLQELVVRSFKAELRERLMRDILDCTHWLLHSMDGAEIEAAQQTGRRALNLLCVSSRIFDGKIDYETVTFIAQEVREIKSLKEKATCEGNA